MADDNQIRITVNQEYQRQLARQFQDFGAYSRQAIEDLVKEEAALVCREAIRYSPPLDGNADGGGGKGDKKIAQTWGNAAISNDVGSFVLDNNRHLGSVIHFSKNPRQAFMQWKQGKAPPGDGIITKIWRDENADRAFKKAKALMANWRSAQTNVLANMAAIQAVHDKLRKDFKGRIRKNNGPKLSQKYLADQKTILDYIKKRQEKVGYMKSGWLDTIQKIGPPKINGVPKNFGLKDMPQWITRHAKRNGSVGIKKVSRDKGDILITVRNDIGNIFGVAYLAGTQRWVMAVRQGKLQRRMAHFQRAAIAKFNRGQQNSI